MDTEPKIQEVDLIKVKVIKKKHIQNLRTRYPMAALDFTKLQMLAYISEWDSILYKDLETQHIGVTNAITYYTSLQEGSTDWLKTNEAAHKFVHSLPQLFLD